MRAGVRTGNTVVQYQIIEEQPAGPERFRLALERRTIHVFSSEHAAINTARSLARLDRASGGDVVVSIHRRDGSVNVVEAMMGDVLAAAG